MKRIQIPFFILIILLGVLAFIYAGIDDSPGGQLIGVILIIISTVGLIKNNKKTRV